LKNCAEVGSPPSKIPAAIARATSAQPMMDSVEVACQITFDDPAALRVGAILQLHPHCTNRMMNTYGKALLWFVGHVIS
jgi:hypothetical protein